MIFAYDAKGVLIIVFGRKAYAGINRGFIIKPNGYIL